MRTTTATLCTIVMIAYIAFRAFTTLMILPMAGSLSSVFGLYSLVILAVAIVATAMSNTARNGSAVTLASLVGIASVCCFVVMCKGDDAVASQGDFKAFVIPEIVFSAAALFKWRSRKALGLSERERG